VSSTTSTRKPVSELNPVVDKEADWMLTETDTALFVTVTEGFDHDCAKEIVAAWQEAMPTGDPDVYYRKAYDKIPQYLQFIGSAAGWALLAPAAVAFLGRLGYHLADVVADAVRDKFVPTPNPLDQLAAAMCAAQRKLPSPATVLVAVNLPDDRWGTALELEMKNEATLSKQLALYVVNIERIASLLSEYCARGEGPLGQGKIVIKEDDQIEISWMSQRDFKRVHLVLPPTK